MSCASPAAEARTPLLRAPRRRGRPDGVSAAPPATPATAVTPPIGCPYSPGDHRPERRGHALRRAPPPPSPVPDRRRAADAGRRSATGRAAGARRAPGRSVPPGDTGRTPCRPAARAVPPCPSPPGRRRRDEGCRWRPIDRPGADRGRTRRARPVASPPRVTERPHRSPHPIHSDRPGPARSTCPPPSVTRAAPTPPPPADQPSGRRRPALADRLGRKSARRRLPCLDPPRVDDLDPAHPRRREQRGHHRPHPPRAPDLHAQGPSGRQCPHRPLRPGMDHGEGGQVGAERIEAGIHGAGRRARLPRTPGRGVGEQPGRLQPADERLQMPLGQPERPCLGPERLRPRVPSSSPSRVPVSRSTGSSTTACAG